MKTFLIGFAQSNENERTSGFGMITFITGNKMPTYSEIEERMEERKKQCGMTSYCVLSISEIGNTK